MSKVYVSLDRDVIKQNYFERIIAKTISKVSGCESSITGPLATKLGIKFDTQKEFLQLGKPTFMRAYMESLIDTIDNSVEEYMIKHNSMFRIDESKVHLANEAATEEIIAEDDGDGMGETLSDMVNEMLDKKVEEIKDVAKLVLRLEKQKQDNDKESLLDENEEIEEENTDSENADFDGEDGENSEDTDDGEEGGNPFGEDSDNGDTFESGDTGTEESGNPFEGTSDESTGDDSDAGGDNPFDSGSEESEGEAAPEDNGGSNPFEESSGDSSNEGEAEGSGNPFESIQDISKITIGGKTPFYGLKNGDMSGFVTGFTRKIFEAPMREAFDQFGQESVQFKDLASKMNRTNRAALESLVAVVSVGQALGFKIDMERVKAWDIYLDD